MLSCAHGDPAKLAIKLLNMTNLKDNIKRKELTYRKPEWLKNMEQKKGNQAQNGGMQTQSVETSQEYTKEADRSKT